MSVGADILPPRVQAGLRAAVGHIRAFAGAGPTAGDASALAARLYADWYARWSLESASAPGRSLVETLRAAHIGAEKWEQGWVVRKVSATGQALAAYGERMRVLDPIDYCNPARAGLPAAPGDAVLVPARRDSVAIQPGFWFTWAGPGANPTLAAGECVRLYWHISAEGAPALVHTVTQRLDECGVAYSLKLPSHAHDYGRADGAVLFLRDSDARHLVAEFQVVHAHVREWLHSPTPALARPLAEGLALAEDPGAEQQSFGTHRCRVIAQAGLAALRRNEPTDDEILRALLDGLTAEGVPPARPHLRAFSSAEYEW